MQNHAKRQFNNNNASVMAAISIGAMLIFSVAGTKAFAQDKVVNDINASVGSVTVTAGQTTQVSYKIIAQKESTDPKPGSPDCNPELDPVTIALNIPTDVTANPTSLDFNQCNVFKDVDFTSTVPGTYTIRVQDAGTEYDEAPATFTLIVKAATPPADETNPTISITSPNDGDTITEDSVTVSGTASDSGSGLAKVEVKVGNSGSYSAASGTSTWSAQVTLADGENTITAQATDNAGNSATDSVTVTYTPPDETAPILEVPTTPLTAEATGPDGAKVSYDVSATDDSGNTSPAATFKVSVTLTMAGFYQPVDMGSTINTVKGGSTVPFKFEIFAGSTELTSTTFNGNPIGVFTAKKVACPGGAAEDPIEQVVTATGGTALRYDATSGQFVYNWQTPKTPVGACYDTTFTVTADGSTLTAHFKTK